MVAYDIWLDLLKYDCTLEPDPDQDQGSPTRSDPEHSSFVRRNQLKKSDRPGSAQSRGNRSEAPEITLQEIEKMSHSFDNAIWWMELAKIHYDQVGDVVVDVCKALGNVENRDIDVALSQVAQKQEVADQDAQISQLTREKELQTRLLKMERSLKLEELKTQGAHRLIRLLEEHIRNLWDLVTKARIYDEAVAKTGSVTALKLIDICVDYSAKMETILVEMRGLFDAQNHFFRGSPIPLEKVLDLLEFPNLPPTEVL